MTTAIMLLGGLLLALGGLFVATGRPMGAHVPAAHRE
jgi:hypothetical protein